MLTQYPPSGFAEAIAAAVLRRALQMLLKPAFSPKVSIARQRRRLQRLARVTRVPKGVAFEPADVAGVPGEWVRRQAGPGQVAPVKPGTLLYLHGGAYCLGSPRTHRALTGRLALGLGLPVLALDYRLAPEHPFPAALDDALAAYRVLARQGPVVIAGDSAGGGLALAVALALRDSGGPADSCGPGDPGDPAEAAPAALVLLSPWVDMAMDQAPPAPPKGEAMLSVPWAQACAALYLGKGVGTGVGTGAGTDDGATPPGHPWVSPLRAELHGLPPTLIQAGTDEMLHDQALALHDALVAAGVAVQCQITPRRWHVFQLHAGSLRSADEAIARVLRFVQAALDALPAGGPISSTAVAANAASPVGGSAVLAPGEVTDHT